MSNQLDLERLRSLKTLPQLIAYLRDELDWPIDQNAVADDYTFDYSPEELGFDADAAVPIREIKQLRPLEKGQPWGIFWVSFAKKRLPVVMLRRILGHLVLKKRAAAQKASQRAWRLHDLLFISAYGEDSDRAVSFAHFSQEPESPGDLPVLKVLGWDDGDTVLHLADVHRTLAEKLRWPGKPVNLEAWREQWSSAFTLRPREVITTTTQLVEELARLAEATRRRANAILARESGHGPLRKLCAAFRAALIHNLTEDDFADVIAQTISYGLLIARFSRAAISAQNLVDMVPQTNPFLRELLAAFLALAGRQKAFDFDELGIQDVVELLNQANADAVKADFGNRTRNEDPVIHFYEHFLAAYDRQKKIKRGVFYTPQPVVSYIVRSVHELLRKEFDIEDGLASTVTWADMLKRWPDLRLPKIRVPKAGQAEGVEVDLPADEFFVMILDIATGTATFLVETIEAIFQHLKAKWEKHGLRGMPMIRHTAPRFAGFKDYWNAYVPAALLPRLYGYELMMAPYTIAHMKLALKLSEINARLKQPDYEFRFEGRAHIYLTNTLEPSTGLQTQEFAEFFPALAHEASAVNGVKRTSRFTVIIGNPPYAGHSSNQGEWIRSLVRDFYFVNGEPLGEQNPKWLQDDYVKFIRFGLQVLADSTTGVLGVITNHGFIENPTFRGVRARLLADLSDIHVLDLHGNSKKKEKCPDGSPDENVFDIQQGVAISVCSKFGGVNGTRVRHGDLYGLRAAKYEALAGSSVRSTGWNEVAPLGPFYLFTDQDTDLRKEFESYVKVTDMMPVHSLGVVTARDDLCIRWDRGDVWDVVREFAKMAPEEARRAFDLGPDARDWQVKLAQQDVRQSGPSEKRVVRILYRPFDTRWTYYTGNSRGFQCMPRGEVMGHMIRGKNIGLSTTRNIEVGSFGHVLCSGTIIGHHCVSLKEVNYLFPLYLHPSDGELGIARQPNFSVHVMRYLARLRATPEDVFHYAYAVFHSPGYRSRYAEFLKMDFPRLPLTANAELFRMLVGAGGELASLHLMESARLDRAITEYTGGRAPEVERVSWSRNTVWLDKAQTVGFKGVREEVWNFHIGGYQVCEKWLKDRKGRMLSADDRTHYQKIVVALSETIKLMAEIDRVIEKHGGWPLK